MTLHIWFRGSVLAVVLAYGAEVRAQAAIAPPSATWRDIAPHRVRSVRVEPGVTLEVLEWGGTGAPLIFLAGTGNAAHVFDGFAPRFTSRFRVLGVTRRGTGASGHPATGYDSATLVHECARACGRRAQRESALTSRCTCQRSFGSSLRSHFIASFASELGR